MQTTVLTAKPAYLFALCGAQSIGAPALVTLGLRDPLRLAWVVGSNSRVSPSRVRPVRTNSTL